MENYMIFLYVYQELYIIVLFHWVIRLSSNTHKHIKIIYPYPDQLDKCHITDTEIFAYMYVFLSLFTYICVCVYVIFTYIYILLSIRVYYCCIESLSIAVQSW